MKNQSLSFKKEFKLLLKSLVLEFAKNLFSI